MSEQLEIGEIISLVNHSRFAAIDTKPIRAEEGWVLYRGEHRVHTAKYVFHLLYIQARATVEQIDQATKAIAGREAVQVVFPSSAKDRVLNPKRSFPPAAVSGYWTAGEYLASYIRDELGVYTSRLPEAPKDYIDPPFEIPPKRKLPPPPLDFIATSPTPGEVEKGTLGVLLADAGQGKTYLCTYLVDRLRHSAGGRIPIFIDSSQWSTIAIDDLRALPKTIVHSFISYGAPIPWVEGCEDEFLRVSLKAGLFAIIFDGFDEYILRNNGSVDPIDALSALSELAQETAARILLTSRVSFWQANITQEPLTQLLARTHTHLFKLLPFDSSQARNYFQRRLGDLNRSELATQIFGRLRNQNPHLVGRGFVLRLIADLVERGGTAKTFPAAESSQLLWLAERLCEREVERQKLPLSASEQVTALGDFARECACGSEGSTTLLEICLQDAKSSLDDKTRLDVVEKMKSHPLLQYEAATGRWAFFPEQVGTALLAEAIADADEPRLAELGRNLALSAAAIEDLAAGLCDSVLRKGPQDERSLRLQTLVRGLADPRPSDMAVRAPGGGPSLRGALLLRAVDRRADAHATREERGQVLRELVGGSMVEGVRLGGAITRLDLRSVEFRHCLFQGVTWVNCEFNASTKFDRCEFAGSSAAPRSEGLADVSFHNCRFDGESQRWFENSLLTAGKRRYSGEDLKADITAVVRQFLSKSGVGVKTVRRTALGRGAIAESPHRDEVIEELLKIVLTEHHLSGVKEGGVSVRPEAEDCVKFYAVNNVLTGPLAEVFDRLKRDFKIRD